MRTAHAVEVQQYRDQHSALPPVRDARAMDECVELARASLVGVDENVVRTVTESAHSSYSRSQVQIQPV